MSKERARRRAERAAAAEAERRKREAARKRADQRAAVVGTVTAPATTAQSRLTRWWRRTYPQGDPFARGRRRRTLVVVAILLVVNILVWILTPSWALRLSAMALSGLLAPVLRTVLFDRR
jgi:Flp pilus assembly protein TadB